MRHERHLQAVGPRPHRAFPILTFPIGGDTMALALASGLAVGLHAFELGGVNGKHRQNACEWKKTPILHNKPMAIRRNDFGKLKLRIGKLIYL